MLYSMTGFGKSETISGSKKIVAEIRSLNSKQLDLSVRLPGSYRNMELELRNLVQQTLQRGKIDITVYFEDAENAQPIALNKELALAYYKAFRELASEVGESGEALLQTVLRMPDVMKAERLEANDDEWNKIVEAVQAAMQSFVAFRQREGAVLQNELELRIHHIGKLLKHVESLDAERLSNVKTRLRQALDEIADRAGSDQNRFEQELIYYLEKLDITEEKVRLKTHLGYFLEVMQTEDAAGRKLNFISQEIGREINTIGSKANHAVIQRSVVEMKDDLEKIKEQSMNIL